MIYDRMSAVGQDLCDAFKHKYEYILDVASHYIILLEEWSFSLTRKKYSIFGWRNLITSS